MKVEILKLFLSSFLCLITFNGFGQTNCINLSQQLLVQSDHHYEKKAFKRIYHVGVKLLSRTYEGQDIPYITEAYLPLELNEDMLQNYSGAPKKYLKALENSAKNTPSRIKITVDLCRNYIENKEVHSIDPFLNELLVFSKKKPIVVGESKNLIAVNDVLGQYYTKTNNYAFAEIHFDQAVEIGKEYKLWEELKNVFLHRSTLYYAHQKNDKAYKNLQLHLFYKDRSLERESLSQLKAQQLKIKQLKFQKQEYDRQINASKEESRILSDMHQTKNKFLWGFAILFLLFLMLVCIVLRSNRIKRRLIVKLNRKNHQLAKAKENAFRAAKVKSQFISNVSHEIRTPLHGIIGITSLLLAEKELSESNKKLIKSLKFSGDYLLSLINNVLMMSKIDNDKVKIQPKRFDLKSMPENILEAVNFSAEKLNCQVSVHIDKNLPRFVYVDGAIIFEILINLIDNAIKFSKNGKVDVFFDCLERDDDKLKIQFKVVDNGPGIPQKKQELIFHNFSQLSTTDSIMEGTGLGLSIVKNLLLLMETNIQLESEIGRGSTFYFNLDVKPVPQEELEIKNQNLKQIYQGKKILLIEDNKINKMIIRKFLKPCGANLKICENGNEGLKEALSGMYDLLLLDINVPGKDGYEISQRMREENMITPIIAVTASEKLVVEKKVLAAGMNDILIKPFSLNDLLEKMNKYLE